MDALKRQAERAEEGEESDESERLEYAPIVRQVDNKADFNLKSRVISWTEEIMQEPEDND